MNHSFRRKLAHLIRRFPILILIPHMIWRFVQPKYSLGVVGVVFNEQGEVLLVEHVFHRLAWGLPGGWVGANETPAEAVQRELQEELQLHVEVEHTLLTKITFRNHLGFAFLCQKKNDIGNLSSELLDYRWIRLEELPTLYPFHHEAIARAREALENGERIHQS